nr:hypothetical protein CFP56_71165 [Quercus suber]
MTGRYPSALRIANLLSNGLHGLEIIVGGGEEARLDYVDIELLGYVEFFLGGSIGAGGLLSFTESGVEDAIRDVIGAAARGRFGCGSGV